MSGKCLLDTNIVIALFANESEVKGNLAQANEVFVASVVIGELFFGARKSARSQENIARIDEFVESNIILGCDAGTASYYGEIKNTLRLKGHPIPENDVWIAAIALQHDLTLITRDAHFGEIENLKTLKW